MTRRATGMFSLTQTQRYGIAILGVMLTAGLHIALSPVLRPDLAVFLFIFPITLACFCRGLGPGLLATGLSVLFLSPPDLAKALSLGITGTVISILFDRIRRAMKATI